MLCDDSDKSHASGRNRELRPDAATSSPLISLRAKTFSVDCSRLFMGSFNMDPRSCHTNTEMGLLIDTSPLTSATASAFTREIPRLAYEVRLNARWCLESVEQNSEGQIIHRHEPSTTAGRRFLSRLISLLPIKPLL